MSKTLRAAALSAVLAAAPVTMFAQGPGGPPRSGPGGCCSAQDTPGWAMMTPAERDAHREKMLGFKDYPACQAYMDEHRKLMAQRAKERGMPGPGPGPGAGGGPGCERLRKAP